MFLISGATRSLLASQHYNHHLRVRADRRNTTDPFVTQFDLTSRLVSGRITASIDSPARTISLSFERGLGADSLSPYVSESVYNNPTALLKPGTQILLEVAVVAPDAPPDGEFVQWEYLYVDSVNAADGPNVTVTGRDYVSAIYLDTRIEEPTAYGPGLVEVVMDRGSIGSASSILTDWMGAGLGGSLVLPTGSPGWTITKYAQQEASVLDALRALALQIGWDLRSFPRFTDDELAFYDPERDRTMPDAVIGLSEYTSLTELSTSIADIRNYVEVRYGLQTTRELAVAEDTDSQALYRRRPMRISEARTSNIDTLVEAQALADAALADLKDPYASHKVETLLWPYVELNDIHGYPANGVHYDGDQTFAVVGYTHTFSATTGRTEIQCRGKPIAANRAYRVGGPVDRIVSTSPPPDGTVEREGMIWLQVDSLDFP